MKRIIVAIFIIVGICSSFLNANEHINNWTEPRSASTISINGDVLRSTADGTETFGMSKKLTD